MLVCIRVLDAKSTLTMEPIMKKFADLVQEEQIKIAAYPAGTSDSIVNSAKVELRAMELLHADLERIGVLASDIAQGLAEGAGKAFTPPTVDSVLQIATLFGAYLPLAYRRMASSGELPLPSLAEGGGGDEGPSYQS